MTLTEISNKINEMLEMVRNGYSSQYFNVEDVNGENVKIRVSNHSANEQNNTGRTLSFVTETTLRMSGKMVSEWAVDEDGYTDTFQTIEEVLDWEDVAG